MKKTILWILLDSVFLAVFNTLFFILGGTEHPISVWISYAFIHLAYIMVVATPILTRKSSKAAVFGFSLYTISSCYFLLEFVVGLIFILIRSESYKATLVVQIVIAGIYAVILLANMIANEHTADNLERQEKEVAYIKNAASRVKLLTDKMSDKKANKAIEKVYDLLHSSPSKTVPEVRHLETIILEKISALESAVKSDSVEKVITICGEIINAAEERNIKLQSSDLA